MVSANLHQEKELYIVRKSSIVFFFHTVIFVFIAWAVPYLFRYLSVNVIGLQFVDEAAFVPRYALAVWYLILYVYYFFHITDFFLDIWIVSNKRILDINQSGLFSRNSAELSLDKIQDITVDVRGLLPTIFGYGSISLQTAGTQREFVMSSVSNPTKAKDIIMKAYQSHEEEVREVRIIDK